MKMNFSYNLPQGICCLTMISLLFLGGCSSAPEKKKSAWNPEEKKIIESVKIVRDLFDVVGCKRVGKLNVELRGEQVDVAQEHLKLKASTLGADTVNEVKYYNGKAFSKEGLIVGEAYKCRI